MSKCCIIDENNKMLPLTHDEAVKRMTYILKNCNASNGIIQFEDKKYEYIELNFENEVVRILKDITRYYRLKEQNEKLQTLVEDLKEENKGLKKDSLTGLYRADCAMKVVRKYILHAYQKDIPFSIIMADIDKFKNVNDTYGHEFGNKVLSTVGKTILENVRTHIKPITSERRKNDFDSLSPLDKGDIVVRYGGEEILILIKDIGLEETIERTEELRKKIESINIDGINITMSFGIFNSSNKENLPEITEENMYRSVSQIVQFADKAMYNSKENGRNITSVYDNEKELPYTIEKQIKTSL